MSLKDTEFQYVIEIPIRSIGTASMRSGHHESDLFFFIDFIKKTAGSDAVTPHVRAEIFETIKSERKKAVALARQLIAQGKQKLIKIIS